MYYKKGFTLIEILIVIVIISISIAVVYPASEKFLNKITTYIQSFQIKNKKEKEKFNKFIKDE